MTKARLRQSDLDKPNTGHVLVVTLTPGRLAMGKERWPELCRLFHSLVNSANVKIRKTLATSLHEVGKILGPVLTEEVIPVF
jgi:hypothetical protein